MTRQVVLQLLGRRSRPVHDDHRTARDDRAPVHGDRCTARDDRVPAHDDRRTVRDDRVPAHGDRRTVRDDRVPAHGDCRTVRVDRVPARGDPAQAILRQTCAHRHGARRFAGGLPSPLRGFCFLWFTSTWGFRPRLPTFAPSGLAHRVHGSLSKTARRDPARQGARRFAEQDLLMRVMRARALALTGGTVG